MASPAVLKYRDTETFDAWLNGLYSDELSQQRLNSMACVALPTCALAMAEAERYLPSLVTKVEGLLAKHSIPDEHFVMRMTGCPNTIRINALDVQFALYLARQHLQ